MRQYYERKGNGSDGNIDILLVFNRKGKYLKAVKNKMPHDQSYNSFYLVFNGWKVYVHQNVGF